MLHIETDGLKQMSFGARRETEGGGRRAAGDKSKEVKRLFSESRAHRFYSHYGQSEVF